MWMGEFRPIDTVRFVITALPQSWRPTVSQAAWWLMIVLASLRTVGSSTITVGITVHTGLFPIRSSFRHTGRRSTLQCRNGAVLQESRCFLVLFCFLKVSAARKENLPMVQNGPRVPSAIFLFYFEANGWTQTEPQPQQDQPPVNRESLISLLMVVVSICQDRFLNKLSSAHLQCLYRIS